MQIFWFLKWLQNMIENFMSVIQKYYIIYLNVEMSS